VPLASPTTGIQLSLFDEDTFQPSNPSSVGDEPDRDGHHPDWEEPALPFEMPAPVEVTGVVVSHAPGAPLSMTATPVEEGVWDVTSFFAPTPADPTILPTPGDVGDNALLGILNVLYGQGTP